MKTLRVCVLTLGDLVPPETTKGLGEKELEPEEYEGFYGLLGAYRGLSEAIRDYVAKVSGASDFSGALSKMVLLADVVAVIGTMDIVFGEIDR